VPWQNEGYDIGFLKMIWTNTGAAPTELRCAVSGQNSNGAIDPFSDFFNVWSFGSIITQPGGNYLEMAWGATQGLGFTSPGTVSFVDYAATVTTAGMIASQTWSTLNAFIRFNFQNQGPSALSLDFIMGAFRS
jgi:hypothetical protein